MLHQTKENTSPAEPFPDDIFVSKCASILIILLTYLTILPKRVHELLLPHSHRFFIISIAEQNTFWMLLWMLNRNKQYTYCITMVYQRLKAIATKPQSQCHLNLFIPMPEIMYAALLMKLKYGNFDWHYWSHKWNTQWSINKARSKCECALVWHHWFFLVCFFFFFYSISSRKLSVAQCVSPPICWGFG